MKIGRRDLLRGGLAGAVVLAGGGRAWAATPGDTLVMARNIDDIISLDPGEVFEFSGGEVINNVYVRLMTFDPADFTKLVGGAAESWSISDDGLTFTFKIRPGMSFHSGRPVTAGDAAFSLQRVVILNKAPGFILTQFGWTADTVRELVTAPNDSTLVLKLGRRLAPSLVLNCLSAGVGSVVEKDLALKNQKDNDLGNARLKTNSAASGAFRLVAWNAKESVVLEANPRFYRGAPKVKRVVIRHIPEASAQRLLLEKGDIDIARNLTPDQVAAVSGNPNIAIVTDPKTNIYYLALNQKNPTLANPKVREAARWLLDYQGMANTVLKGQYQVHQGFWGAGAAGALTDKPYKLDVARAKQLLAEAGFAGGFQVDLDAGNSPPHSDVAQSIQATFAQAGVKVNVVQADTKQVLTKYRARNHQMVLMYWSPDYLDPHSTADYFTRNPDNSDNARSKTVAWRNSWEIPDLTKATEAAMVERDAAKRTQMYLDLQRRVQTESPVIVMFQQTEQAAIRKGVTGYVSGPSFDTHVFWQVSK